MTNDEWDWAWYDAASFVAQYGYCQTLVVVEESGKIKFHNLVQAKT
jgi:hypothetical protein